MSAASTAAITGAAKIVALEVKQLTVRYRYQDDPVLRELDLTVNAGERVAIMGPSGCGKSSLLTHLAGLRQCEAGEVFLFGQALHSLSGPQLDKLRAEQLGFVFQQAHLLPRLSVYDNLALCAESLPTSKAQTMLAEIPQWLERLGLSNQAKQRADTLSVGQAQRVAVARGLIRQPSIVFADEPTGALDGDNVAAVTQMLCNEESDQTLIIATHDHRVADSCDRVLTLQNGCWL